MQKEADIQEALRTAFPEFNNKNQLINYYVSFEFPEKQMKMVSWWQKVIEFIIEHEHKAYISYQQLTSYLSVYNLKPTPLPAILNYLAKKQQIVPQSQYEIRQTMEQSRKQKQKGWFSNLMSYVSKQSAVEQQYFKCQANERIFSRKIKEFKKQQIKKVLDQLFTQHCKSMNQFKLTQKLEQAVNLDRDSIQELLKQLNREQVLKLVGQAQKPFVLYSHSIQDFNNNEWCEIEKMKFCLREQIDKFEFMMGKEQQKITKLREKAKEQVANGNRKNALATCKEMKEKQKKIDSISTRKNILQNQITQLEYNEMNKTTLTLLEEAHAIYEQTMIDQTKLDQLTQKNMEIEINNKNTNQKLETMLGKEDYEEDVDAMMKELQKQLQPQHKKLEVNPIIPMEIERVEKRKVEVEIQGKKEIKMEIEREGSNSLQFN